MYNIYTASGNIRTRVHEVEYSGTYMGGRYVTLSVHSSDPINWENGDYIDFRGERFTLRYIPGAKKAARRGMYGGGFAYEQIRFESYADELTRCSFLDVVLRSGEGESAEHYTMGPKVTFYANSVRDLADRIQANLDRLYKGESRWTVEVAEGIGRNDQTLTLDNVKVWDALVEVQNTFDCNFVINGRKIAIGATEIIEHQFGYGKGNGLTEIEQTTEDNADIITRLRAYGSTKNLPYRYYNNIYVNRATGQARYYKENEKPTGAEYVQLVDDCLYLPNLMPYSWKEKAVEELAKDIQSKPLTTAEYFIDSENQQKYGLNEGVKIFDQDEDDYDEVYPTMEGMEARKVGANWYIGNTRIYLSPEDNGRLDEVKSATQLTDSGIAPEEGTLDPSTFTIRIKDIGFDISQYVSVEGTPTIWMKSGMCVGRGFEIINVEAQTVGNVKSYVLTCNRVEDNDLMLFFPNKDYNIQADDTFVLTNIYMPDVYVDAASMKLDEQAMAYLAENDHCKYVYQPKMDNIFLQTHPDIAASLYEGKRFILKDQDLDIDTGEVEVEVMVTALRIKDDGQIMQYEVTLAEEKEADLVDRVASTVSSLLAKKGVGMTSDNVLSLLRLYGDKRFITKIQDDGTEYNLSAGALDVKQKANIGNGADVKGLLATENFEASKDAKSDDFVSGDAYTGGAGWGAYKRNQQSHLEVDNLLVRNKATFTELEIRKLSAVGGNIVLSAASSRVEHVTVTERALYTIYRCYIKTDDGSTATENNWMQGDLARCQTFDVKAGNKNYGYRVMGVGTDNIGAFVEFRSNNRWTISTDVPEAGDVIVQMGSDTEVGRRNIIVLETSGAEPVICCYQGVNSYDIAPFMVSKIGASQTVFKTSNFKVTNDFLTTEQIVIDKGEYVSKHYDYYDRVSKDGSLWLCVNPGGNEVEQGQYIAPSASASDIWLQQVSRGDTGAAGGAINAYMSPNAVVVPATQEGGIDTGFGVEVPYMVFSGSENVTSQYQVMYIQTACCYAVPLSNGTIRFSSFTSGGNAKVYLGKKGGSSSDIIDINIEFTVVSGGGDAYTIGADKENFGYTLNKGDDRPTAIIAYLYVTRGGTMVTSEAQWNIESYEGCSNVVWMANADGKRRLRVGRMDADEAQVAIKATIGRIEFVKVLTYAITRNGADGTKVELKNGQWVTDNEQSGVYASSFSSQLDKYAVTIPVNYNDRVGRDTNNYIDIIPSLWWSASEIVLDASDIEIEVPSVPAMDCGTIVKDGKLAIRINAVDFGNTTTIGGVIKVTIKSEEYGGYRHSHYVGFDVLALETTMDDSSWYVKGYKKDGNNYREVVARFGVEANAKGGFDAKIQADNISLEGYTTINKETRIDEAGNLYAKNAQFDNCVLEGYLRSMTQADWNSGGVGEDVIPVKSVLNIMTNNQRQSHVYLPNDPEYIGARVTIIAPSGISNTNGEIGKRIGNVFTNIYTGHTFANHMYKRDARYGDMEMVGGYMNMYLDASQDTDITRTSSPFGDGTIGGSWYNWFVGAKAAHGEAEYCPRHIRIQNGAIELLGVPAMGGAVVCEKSYKTDDNGQIVLDEYGYPVTTGRDPMANEEVTFCQWVILNINGEIDYFV